MSVKAFSWLIFSTIITALLALDLGVLNKKDEAMGFKKSLLVSFFYITIACLFGIFVLHEFDQDRASEYYTGFLLEKVMSLDNIFVISIIFKFFKIPEKYQHRVLFWGILGVILLRAIMIYAGSAALNHFEWVLFIFASILIFTGIKTLHLVNHTNINIKNMLVYKWLAGHLNLTTELVGNKFVTRKEGKLCFTPLFVALVIIESMDLVFALDSIPAIFAVTQDTFIIYTSNIFAILGLRALFFCLADMIKKFKYVKYSLAIILILIGIKIFVAPFIVIPKIVPLLLTIGLILAGIFVSVIKNEK